MLTYTQMDNNSIWFEMKIRGNEREKIENDLSEEWWKKTAG